MPAEDALDAISAISNNSTILVPTKVTYYIFIELVNKYKVGDEKISDMYLVATALSSGVKEIATDNTKGFNFISEIETFNPFLSQRW